MALRVLEPLLVHGLVCIHGWDREGHGAGVSAGVKKDSAVHLGGRASLTHCREMGVPAAGCATLCGCSNPG